ncbi:MAG: hypothetical protein JWS12_536 [Candidatus Saccharibacteria bacterium]|nr:hypothetical protein [Candidatus Saccharibacteria bacterium]
MDESDGHTKTAKLKNHNHLSTKILSVLVALLLVSTVVLSWRYNQARHEVKNLKNPQNSVKQEADALKAKVGQLVDLPAEEPTIAAVSDVTKLQGQAFFAKAQNGDKVLIFPNAARAVLYRPSTNKVIEYAPVNLGTSATAGTTPSTPIPTPTVKKK